MANRDRPYPSVTRAGPLQPVARIDQFAAELFVEFFRVRALRKAEHVHADPIAITEVPARAQGETFAVGVLKNFVEWHAQVREVDRRRVAIAVRIAELERGRREQA